MLEEKVEKFLRQKNFTLNGKRMLVGVSGGPDSLALLNYLWKRQQCEDFFIVVAHVDHMFRGMESFNEAKFVEGFCEERHIPFTMKQINVPEYMENTGKSLEVSARENRYQFFSEVMNEFKLTYAALAHHGDDQIETMLMRLTRGSSGYARAGISFLRPFHNGFVFRPFLCLSRQEIESYCVENQLNPRHDPSNEQDDYLRNRFRKYVVPFLRKENSHVHENFQRFSEELQQDEELLQKLTIQQMNTVWKEKKHGKITIDIDAFHAMPIPLQRRGIQLILNYLYKERPASLSAIHIDHVFSLMNSVHPSGSLDFPSGLKVIRSYRLCYFRYATNHEEEYRIELNEPGEYLLPNGDSIVFQYTETKDSDANLDSIQLNIKDVALPFVVRTREPGDRMSLKGMEGTKKIKRIFIDQKIPVNERKVWPVVTDSNNHILWLPGLKRWNLEAERGNEAGSILLTYKRG